MCIGVLPVCMHACMLVHPMCAWCLPRAEEDVGYPGTWITDGWELPCSSGSSRRAAQTPNYWTVSLALVTFLWLKEMNWEWVPEEEKILVLQCAVFMRVLCFWTLFCPFFLLRSSLCSWTWRSSASFLLVLELHEYTPTPSFIFLVLFFLVVLGWYFHVINLALYV